MAAPKSTDRWNVLVISADEEKTSTYRLAVGTSLGSIRARWSEEQGVPVDSTVFRLLDGTVADDGKTLLDVGEGQRGSRTVNLWVEEQVMMYLRLYQEQEAAPLPLNVSLSLTPEEIHPQIQRIFSLSAERPFRLRSPLHGPLVYSLSLGEQGVRPDALLHVDLAYHVTVKEMWEGVTERRLLHSSDTISELSTWLPECPRHPERIMLGLRQLDTRRELVTLQRIYQNMSMLSLRHESQRPVVTLFAGRLQQRLVWPTERARSLIADAPRGSDVLFEGRPLLPQDTMKRLRVQEGSLLTTGARILVTLSNRKRKFVRLPDRSTVGELREALLEQEKDADFVLRSGGRLLDLHETVEKLTAAESVEVEREGIRFLVSLHDRSVRWASKGPPQTPSQFLYQLAEKGSESWSELTKRTLVCAGCGRTISVAEDDFQLLPAPCCRVRSLHLREPVPPVLLDAETQAECWIPRNTEETTDEEEPSPSIRPPPQVVAEAEEKNDLDQDNNPPSIRLPFRVQCRFKSLLGETFEANLDLADAPTGLDVKKGLARLLETPAKELRLSRTVALATDVYRVCDDQRPDWEGYCDVTGGVERGEEEMETRPHSDEVVTDDDVFVAVPNRRNYINVSRVTADEVDDYEILPIPTRRSCISEPQVSRSTPKEEYYYEAEYETLYETVTVNGVQKKQKWWRRVKKSASGFQKFLSRGNIIKRRKKKRKKKKDAAVAPPRVDNAGDAAFTPEPPDDYNFDNIFEDEYELLEDGT